MFCKKTTCKVLFSKRMNFKYLEIKQKSTTSKISSFPLCCFLEFYPIRWKLVVILSFYNHFANNCYAAIFASPGLNANFNEAFLNAWPYGKHFCLVLSVSAHICAVTFVLSLFLPIVCVVFVCLWCTSSLLCSIDIHNQWHRS